MRVSFLGRIGLARLPQPYEYVGSASPLHVLCHGLAGVDVGEVGSYICALNITPFNSFKAIKVGLSCVLSPGEQC